jgi:hypothetical protein
MATKQKQTYKNKSGGFKTTKFTDKKTDTSKVIIERLKPSQPKKK